ncbi:MAG: DUF3037 domain-containing protein [Planctomycetes bacterium]|nr:DUF3037 domain-containing protein [Planctomycetota bacterium]
MKPNKGWFSIVQFCPDPNRLESANIGVLLFCPALDFLSVRMASDNRRIIKFFGSKDFDLTLVNSFKKGFEERLRKEHGNIVDHEQLLDFVDRRANQIRISPPRSIRVTEPEKQLDDLFAELIGESARRDTSFKDLLAKSLEQPGLESKLYKSIAITVPIDGRQLQVPYAFQNGRFNLIKPVRFQSENPLQTAYRYAVEGNSIYETEHDKFGKLQLLVVGGFRSQSDENKPLVNRVLENHHVSLYAMDEVDKLVHEILVTGKDLSADAL